MIKSSVPAVQFLGYIKLLIGWLWGGVHMYGKNYV